jgi:membrane-associated phospholipid phosphatase
MLCAPLPEEDDSTMTALASRPASAPPGRGLGHVAWPLLVSAVAAAGVALIYQVFVLRALGQSVDTAALRGADVGHPRAVELMNRALNGTTLASLVLVCLAAAAIGVIRRRLDLAVGAGLLVLAANATTQVLKNALDRPDLDGFPAPNSFPSGHATAAASVAFALVLVLPAAIRGMVSLIGATYVAVIAVATVWAEWHRPSDTIAALLVVLAWGGLIAAVLRARRMRAPAAAGRRSRVSAVLFLLTAAATTAVAAVGLIAVAMSERVTPDLVSGRFAFLTGAAGITAAVAATFLIWVRLAAGEHPTTPVEADAQGGTR